jgi:hypothetical protein
MKTLTRKRPSPGSDTAKSSSHSLMKCSRCADVISAYAVWRTVSGVSTCLFTDRIWPSILILMGALEVKNRSDALRSTISLNNGLVLSVGWRPPATAFTTSVIAGFGPVISRSSRAGAGTSLATFTGCGPALPRRS